MKKLRGTSISLRRAANYLFKDKIEGSIFIVAFLVEIAVGLYLIHRWGYTFTCEDAISHLYIPRSVVDNGPRSTFANLGVIWLPMFHLLVMPLVLINPLYMTGLAGTIVNALATGGISVVLYRLVDERKLGILASAFFMGNAFTLIYGAAPMTEQTAIFFMVLATYFFKRYWETDNVTEFMKCSIALVFGTLTRYEVWIVALLIVLIFTMRELKNGRNYRIVYAHLPFWGIIAWLFWNLAIFRDPLMFMHHPMGTPEFWLRFYFYFAGNASLTTMQVFYKLSVISGALWLFAIPSALILLIRRKIAQLASAMLLTSPVLFQWYFMYANLSGGLERFFYLGYAGIVLFFLFLVKEFREEKLKVVLAVVAIATIIITAYPTQVHILKDGGHGVIFPTIYELKNEIKTIHQVVNENTVLCWYGSQYSVFTGTSPSLIIDGKDGSFFLKVMEEPWVYSSFVTVEKTSANNQALKALNEYYEGKFYVYRFYNDETWRLTFLNHYTLVIETDHLLLYQNVSGAH